MKEYKNNRFDSSSARDSNMELLRMIAMLFVMILHSNSFPIGNVKQNLTLSAGFPAYFIESLAIVAVNAFVLLSGWYGIKFSVRRLCSFLFQVFFFSLLLLFVSIFFGANLDISRELFNIFTLRQYWFVRAYILLMLLSPALNFFAEQSSKKAFGIILILFFLFQTIFAYINNSPWYEDGYSPLPFIGLYLLARYIRIHINLTSVRTVRSLTLSGYLFLTLLLTVTYLLLEIKLGTGGRIYNYTNPLVILSSLCFILFFSTLKIKSRTINWIAGSSFAAYLLHISPYFLNNHYLRILREWSSDILSIYMVKSFLFICAIYFISILIDKIRLLIWNRIWPNDLLNRKSLK